MDTWKKITTRSDEGAYFRFSPFADEHSGYINQKEFKDAVGAVHLRKKETTAAGQETPTYNYKSEKRKSMSKLMHIVSPLLRRTLLFHPIKRKMKKLSKVKIRDCTQSSSTIISLGEEDSVFTSSTIVSTSSSIPRPTEMTEAVLLSPNQLLKVKTEGIRMEKWKL